ncbi:hypothetical protein MC885_009646 [Smutsia gigantea]|nr:hypothetical protein MC885_009646 [Smutsia gigantea]
MWVSAPCADHRGWLLRGVYFHSLPALNPLLPPVRWGGFGFSDKVTMNGHVPVGLYGNGFKSGSMRLGKDAIVFTKNGESMSVGFLSQTYLEVIKAEHVDIRQMINLAESKASLAAILEHSLFSTEQKLLAELDAIMGKKGTRIIIWNLRSYKNATEFDFDKDKYDIRIPEDLDETTGKKGYKKQERMDQVAPESDYSLRTKTVRITFGFNCRNKDHYGIMMYHRNRLIKAYEKVGCQLRANNMGVGVVGIIECNFLKPTHNKQDFDYTNEYRQTRTGLLLEDMGWFESTAGVPLGGHWAPAK